MRGRRNTAVPVRWLMTIAAAALAATGTAALAGTESVAAADPLPRPNAHARGVAGKGHGSTRHGAGRKGHHHIRPRTVVRCQNDDTDQIDEIDNDGGEPQHIVSPGGAAPGGGHCAGVRDALGIAGLLAGDHRTRAGMTGRAPARR
jgi:hypothetical protein